MIRQVVIASLLLATGVAQAEDRTLDKSFDVSPGGSLVVEADGASVQVAAGEGDKVVVHMTARGKKDDLDKMKFEAVQSGSGVNVTMRREKKHGGFNWGSWSEESRIEVTVPKQYQVNVRTGGGNVDLTGTTGAARLSTSGGDMKVKNVTGEVNVRTSGGAIVAETIRGDIDASTSGGDVQLMNVDGKIRGNTSGGSVRVRLVGANRGVTASTSGGDIELILPRSTAGELDASTSGGDIKLDLDVATSVRKDDRVRGTLNGGGPSIDAHTSGGSVSVRAAD